MMNRKKQLKLTLAAKATNQKKTSNATKTKRTQKTTTIRKHPAAIVVKTKIHAWLFEPPSAIGGVIQNLYNSLPFTG